MVELLYVGRGAGRFGPFSAAQLRQLAAAGRLRATDTVWKEGLTKGVLAARVKNLFPAPATEAPPPSASAPGASGTPSPPQPAGSFPPPSPAAAVRAGGEPAPPVVPGTPEEPDPAVAAGPTDVAALPPPPSPGGAGRTAPSKAAPNRGPSGRLPEPARKRRAVGLKGAVLVSQDGEYVHYRKKCSQCGFEDGCRSTLRIGIGLNRAHFFCPKCRKSRDVQIQGMMQ